MFGGFLFRDWVLFLAAFGANIAVVACAFLVWRGLRGAGLRADRYLLAGLILLVLAPTLIVPGMSFMLIPFLPPTLALMGIPLLTPFAVAYFLYRGMAGTGLPPKRAALLAAICGALLFAVAAFHVAANAYVASHHLLGSLLRQEPG